MVRKLGGGDKYRQKSITGEKLLYVRNIQPACLYGNCNETNAKEWNPITTLDLYDEPWKVGKWIAVLTRGDVVKINLNGIVRVNQFGKVLVKKDWKTFKKGDVINLCYKEEMPDVWYVVIDAKPEAEQTLKISEDSDTFEIIEYPQYSWWVAVEVIYAKPIDPKLYQYPNHVKVSDKGWVLASSADRKGRIRFPFVEVNQSEH